MKKAFQLFFILLYTIILFSQTNQNFIPGESKLVKLFGNGYFTEGPAFAPDGSIYFSDLTFTEETGMDAGIIWKHDTETGTTSVYRSPSGMANGIKLNNKGEMIICEGADFGGRRIVKTNIQTGKSKILAAMFNGVQFNSPNDLVIDSKGRIYFTDPRYVGWENIEQHCFGVYRIDEDNSVTLLISDIAMPNGIAISPDQKKLYIGCNYEGDFSKNIDPEMSVYLFDLDPAGNVHNKRKFLEFAGEAGPDGIIIDRKGNLLVALRDEANPGIYIYDEFGSKLDIIPLPEVPSNLTFGTEAEDNILYVTAGGSLYQVNLFSKGL